MGVLDQWRNGNLEKFGGKTTADSMSEFEYIATSNAAKEATWLKNFINDVGLIRRIKHPMEIFSDNKGAIVLTKEPNDHGKYRHIIRKYNYIWKCVEDGYTVVSRVSSKENPANPFTKPLSRAKHDIHSKSTCMRFASDIV